jgi:hypothetical protein
MITTFTVQNYLKRATPTNSTTKPMARPTSRAQDKRGQISSSQQLPVPGLNHLEATAIQVILAGRPVLILAAYLSTSHPLIGADLTACFGGGLLVLMAGDLNAKHVDWNSRLTTRRGKLLRDYEIGRASCRERV